MRDGRLHVAPIKTTATPEGRDFAGRIEAMVATRVRGIAEHDASSSCIWSVVGATRIIRTTTAPATLQWLVAQNATLSGLTIAHSLRGARFGGGSELSLSCLGKGLHGDC